MNWLIKTMTKKYKDAFHTIKVGFNWIRFDDTAGRFWIEGIEDHDHAGCIIVNLNLLMKLVLNFSLSLFHAPCLFQALCLLTQRGKACQVGSANAFLGWVSVLHGLLQSHLHDFIRLPCSQLCVFRHQNVVPFHRDDTSNFDFSDGSCSFWAHPC